MRKFQLILIICLGSLSAFTQDTIDRLSAVGCRLSEGVGYEKTSVDEDTTKSPRRHEGYYATKHFSILGGYTGLGFQYGELGLAINEHGADGHHAYAWAMFASTELFISRERFVIAPKIGAWMANGSAFGLNLLYYTDGKEGSLCFRPEFGLGINVFKLTYGYNFRLVNRHFQNVNMHALTFTFLIQVQKLKTVGSRESFTY